MVCVLFCLFSYWILVVWICLFVWIFLFMVCYKLCSWVIDGKVLVVIMLLMFCWWVWGLMLVIDWFSLFCSFFVFWCIMLNILFKLLVFKCSVFLRCVSVFLLLLNWLDSWFVFFCRWLCLVSNLVFVVCNFCVVCIKFVLCCRLCCCCCVFFCVVCWMRLFDVLVIFVKVNGRFNVSVKVVFLSVII